MGEKITRLSKSSAKKSQSSKLLSSLSLIASECWLRYSAAAEGAKMSGDNDIAGMIALTRESIRDEGGSKRPQES